MYQLADIKHSCRAIIDSATASHRSERLTVHVRQTAKILCYAGAPDQQMILLTL